MRSQSEHGGLRQPPETHLDLPLSSIMTLLLVILNIITKTRPCNIHNFHCCKNDNFQLNFFLYFHIFAQNIDCGPQCGGSNEYPQSMF